MPGLWTPTLHIAVILDSHEPGCHNRREVLDQIRGHAVHDLTNISGHKEIDERKNVHCRVLNTAIGPHTNKGLSDFLPLIVGHSWIKADAFA